MNEGEKRHAFRVRIVDEGGTKHGARARRSAKSRLEKIDGSTASARWTSDGRCRVGITALREEGESGRTGWRGNWLEARTMTIWAPGGFGWHALGRGGRL